jgi:2-methylcitrate dehydratase PrpD
LTSSRCGTWPNHALSTTLAGVLAPAEARAATGREVLTTLVKGVEMQGWIRQASGQFEARTTRFHPPGAVGPLGAAVAAGHILRLDADRLANAIGIAASRAGSILANAGSMTKSTHCGHASALGLESALLAERGFTANVDVFEAAQGYVPAFYDDGFKAEEMLAFGRVASTISSDAEAITQCRLRSYSRSSRIARAERWPTTRSRPCSSGSRRLKQSLTLAR